MGESCGMIVRVFGYERVSMEVMKREWCCVVW